MYTGVQNNRTIVYRFVSNFKLNSKMKQSNNNQIFLKLLLFFQTLVVLIYTAIVFKNEGNELLQVFISNVSSMGWSGQFNLDFNCYLTLSGLWIMWRNKYSVSSIIIGLLAMVLGIIFFAPYLLYLLKVENSNLKKVIIGDR